MKKNPVFNFFLSKKKIQHKNSKKNLFKLYQNVQNQILRNFPNESGYP